MAGKLLYRDIVPYETPSSLSALHGPASGVLELPITVHWGPSRRFDLSDTGQRRMAYRALVREGTPEVQEALLNETLLRAEWAELILPERCRALWEERFPELAA
ncbi:transcriptional regulator [Nocardioides rotundus]|uniref:transcriptional regulator n=1 Tax=Nocardioides rotundus TaxID=1774216 RepID=UPI001CBBF4E6|nr:transcriptional regulator [Nocardioides rotundus]UAL30425.1 transcriptional regulator [Nocardioides rotundus]